MKNVATLPYAEQQQLLATLIKLAPDHPKISEARDRLEKWNNFEKRSTLGKFKSSIPTEFPKYEISPDDDLELVLRKSHHNVLVQRIKALESAYWANAGGPELQDVILAYQDLLQAELALGERSPGEVNTYKLIVKNLRHHEGLVQALNNAERKGGEFFWLATIKSVRLEAEIVLLQEQKKSSASWPSSLP